MRAKHQVRHRCWQCCASEAPWVAFNGSLIRQMLFKISSTRNPQIRITYTAVPAQPENRHDSAGHESAERRVGASACVPVGLERAGRRPREPPCGRPRGNRCIAAARQRQESLRERGPRAARRRQLLLQSVRRPPVAEAPQAAGLLLSGARILHRRRLLSALFPFGEDMGSPLPELSADLMSCCSHRCENSQ